MRDRVSRHPNYVERGITCCERWNDFASFLEDMGECPPGLTLERIDNDGNYEPTNCVWASRLTQNRNRRPSSSIKRFKDRAKHIYKRGSSYVLTMRLKEGCLRSRSVASLNEALEERANWLMERQMFHLLGGL